MSQQESFYRFNFNKNLEPIMSMLSSKKKKSTHEKWLEFVERTKGSVLNQPEQYLGRNLPDLETITKLVTELFDDFLKQEIPG